MARPDPRPRFLQMVIHPQNGSMCSTDRVSAWPEDGFQIPFYDDVTIWYVPRIKDARLVDCGHCHKTGVQPLNYEAVVRYIPGAVLVESEGAVTVHLPSALAVELLYPTGSGEDEVERE